MLGRVRIGLKFLAWGLVLGLLFAPRSGADTRRRIAQWTTRLAESAAGWLLGVMTARSDHS
jgi:gas vesicle protein